MRKLLSTILLFAMLTGCAFWKNPAEDYGQLRRAEQARARISDYQTATEAAADDVVIGTDVSDTTMAATGTTKKFPLSTLPISTAVQSALDGKQATLTGAVLAAIVEGLTTHSLALTDVVYITDAAGNGYKTTIDGMLGLIADGHLPAAITRDAEWDTQGKVETIWGVTLATDTELGAKADTASPTFTGLVTTEASDSSEAGLRIPHGTAPTSPVNGDIWTTTDGVYIRINGSTVGPLGAAGASGIWETTARTSAPGSPATKTMYLADNDSWDPAAVTGTDPYWVGYDGADYFAVLTITGTWLISSVETPTLLTSELNDTTSPHTLTETELKNTILTNSGATGAIENDFPARSEGWFFVYVIEAAQNVVLDPNGTEQWYLNGSQGTAGQNVKNVAPTIGESITCFSTESAVYCKSSDSDWAFE